MLNDTLLFHPARYCASKAGGKVSSSLELTRVLTLVFSTILLLSLLGLTALGQKRTELGLRQLPVGKTTNYELSGDQRHRFIVSLQPNEFFQVQVEQKGVDVMLRLLDANGKELARMDSPNGKQGKETLSFVSDAGGRFTLEVGSVKKEAEKGSYAIKREAARNANIQDRKRIAIEQMFVNSISALDTQAQKKQGIIKLDEALRGWQELKDDYMSHMTAGLVEQLKQETEITEEQRINRERVVALLDEVKNFRESNLPVSSAESFQDAQNKAFEALKICRDTNDKYSEGVCLFVIAGLYGDRKEPEYAKKALEYYEKVISAINSGQVKTAEMKNGERLSLMKMGSVYYDQELYAEALRRYSQALALYGENETDKTKADIFERIGNVQSSSKRLRESEAAYSEANKIYKELNLELDRGVILSKLGRLYLEQDSQSVKAINTLLEAENLLEGSPGKTGYQDRRIFNLFSIIGAYRQLNNLEKEAFYLRKVEKAFANISDPDMRQLYYVGVAGDLASSGRFSEALQLYEKALDTLKDYESKAPMLVKTEYLKQITFLCVQLEQKEKADAAFNQVWALVKDSEDKTYLVRFLSDIGEIFFKARRFDEAVQYYTYALDVWRSNRSIESDNVAEILNSLGKAYLESGKTAEALIHFRMALWMRTVFGNKDEIAEIMHDFMISFNRMGKRRLAIFFGKQAITFNQEFRHSITPLEMETQKAFLKGNRATYEQLATLLIQEGRLGEAQEVINFYEDQEFFDLAPSKSDAIKELTLTQREMAALTRYRQLSTKLRPFGQILRSPALTEHGREALEAIEKPFKESPHEFNETFREIEADFDKPVSKEDKVEIVQDLLDMRAALAGAGKKAAIIYTLAAKDGFYALLITLDGIKAFSNPGKASDINARAQSFRSVLQASIAKSNDDNSALYDIIFKSASIEDKNTTLEMELEKYKPEVLLWSLDGMLNSIPLAALYDAKSKQYVVEKYQTAVFTRVRPERFLGKPANWTEGLGLGTSETELSEVFGNAANGHKGIISGKVIGAKSFTRERMIEALDAKRFHLVHIATHFSFQRGDAHNSFLTMGDARRFTLADMQNYPRLFSDVELLVLSACETATQEPNSNGKEIDGFAELAQRLGARAVIATLWNISDKGTSKLMIEFYRLHKKNPDWSKSEVLRQAQLALLRGNVTDAKASLANPYYWAPFVLYGNFR
jgi:CHAT domain-containing protein